MRAVRDTVAELRPDVVHAHSSFAGVYVRLAAALDRMTPGRDTVPVVYTPHSFAFERADIPAAQRRAFRLLEKMLYPLTTVGAPCAVWEGELMCGLGHGLPWTVPVTVVPNVLAEDHPAPVDSWSPTLPQTVGVVSRVTPQRDPAFFAATARLIRGELPETRFVWIGDGDGKDTSLIPVLENAGVEVTGWLNGDELHRRIAELSVVVHTARWDGFPMSVLEVRRIGVPLLVRDIPALQECPAEARFGTPEDAARRAVRILTAGRTLRTGRHLTVRTPRRPSGTGSPRFMIWRWGEPPTGRQCCDRTDRQQSHPGAGLVAPGPRGVPRCGRTGGGSARPSQAHRTVRRIRQ